MNITVDVLLSTYAKCLVGRDEISKRRISEVLSRLRHVFGTASRRGPTTPDSDA
jgi:hypothetical protein